MPFENAGNRLIWTYDCETLVVEPWGHDAFRIRATKNATFEETDGALLPARSAKSVIAVTAKDATITNGKISARIHDGGRLTFTDVKGTVLLDERWRSRGGSDGTYNATKQVAREYRSHLGGNYRISVKFEARDGEKIFGMGQYQDGKFDQKGSVLELAHRNSQASVPFMISNLGYGLLWNNPAIGRATFASNLTEFVSESTKRIDYWITCGDGPAAIEENYAEVTGKTPMMPEYAMGFWQCKLRYRSQAEVLEVAREYKRRGLPLDVIVVDFFHWPVQGDWKFDLEAFPDPDAMVKELKSMGVELMVSVWPTVDKRSENYKPMLEQGLLVRTERGIRQTMDFMGATVFFDATNPKSREYVWKVNKKNYFDKGIRLFWLDEAEPEYTVYDFDNYRYYAGTDLEVGNSYPVGFAQAFYEGMKAEGMTEILSLVRCAWAGSQRYGALIWSGDIECTWDSLRRQLAAGLNMAIAGIPWWTTDIGGFGGGDPDDPAYRELLVRWFQWGAFCPVHRLHGFRKSNDPNYSVTHGRGDKSSDVFSGGPNEVWSYGDEACETLSNFIRIRERMKPYIKTAMKAAHEKGTPPMRPLFYDYPVDEAAWDIGDEYMFGSDLLVAPILHSGARKRSVYLPKGSSWRDSRGGALLEGGSTLEVDAPLSYLPVFVKDGKAIDLYGK
ncbi:MAG: TIM-barrel domain-containing protein [Treponemataceae bacterium]